MSVNRWRGDAIPQAQTETFTVGSSTAGQTFGVTINGKTLSYTAVSGDTVATVTNGLQAVLSASSAPAEFQEVTWTSDGVSAVTATAATPGVPFVTATAGTGTLTKATVTASSGPSHADAAANWTLGALPTTGDDVLIDGGADLLYGLQNLTAAAYNSLRVQASFTGNIGLPVWHNSGGGFTSSGSGYYEYRTRQWSLHTAVPVTIGEGSGAGPKLVNLAVATALDLVVLKTGTPTSAGGAVATPAVNVSGCSSGTLSIAAGSVGIAADDNSLAATVGTASMTGGTLTVGVGATVTTLNQDAGTVNAYGAVATLTLNSGTYTQYDGSLTTVTANGGTVDYRIGGTITSATFQNQGGSQNTATLECANDPRAKTITAGSFTGGAVLHDPFKTTTWTSAQTWDAPSLAASSLGPKFTLTRT
jgi:hypothetical protein